MQTADMLDLDVPALRGGKPIIVESEPDWYVKQVMEDFVVRAERIRAVSYTHLKGWVDDFNLHYEMENRSFERGQTFHNFNDHDYMVLEALSPRNLVVMDMKSGSLTIALGATEYKRYPKEMCIRDSGKRGKATWLYIDEFHVLLNSEYSAKYLQQLWKKARKRGGLCTGITQNVVDLLQNYTATTMLANSEFVALLKQTNTDSSKMAEVIGVSEAQLRFVTNTASGMGLIKFGSVVIPFDNQISKDTDLYRLYNTNIHEKIAMMKKEKLPEKVIERSGES